MFGPSQQLTGCLQRTCAELDDLYIYKALHEYPSNYQLVQILGVFHPEIVFLEMTSAEKALGLTREIQVHSPRTAIVGYAQQCEPELAMQATRAGVREFLRAPFTSEQLARAVLRIVDAQKSGSGQNLFAFLPAKAGSGATTVSLQVAGALAGEWKKRVLLIEGDLESGPLDLLLDLPSERSILDALENSRWLDEKNWSELPYQAQGIDVLPAPKHVASPKLVSWNCLRLLNFVGPLYDCVVVDLPEALSDAAEAIVGRAKAVFVVCTAEKLPLLLARRRIDQLRSRGARDNQIQVVLNRHTANEVKVESLEKILGRPVVYSFPNDYPRIRRSILDCRLIDPKSELGKSFANFAGLLLGEAPPHKLVDWLIC